MNNSIITFKRLVCIGMAYATCITGFSGTTVISVGIIGATMITTAPEAEARRTVSRTTTVRHTRTAPGVGYGTVRRTSRRTARRTTRRVARRHYYALPVGYRPYVWRSHRYYYYSGIYYYPYYISGRTVYVEIDVDDDGKPLEPPPASTIKVEIDID